MSKQLWGCLVCVAITALSLGQGFLPGLAAQDSGKAAAKSEKGGEAKGAKKKSGDRLPANYAKIGLTDAQKSKIYETQSKFDSQIDALEKQIADLKAKQASEVEAILTDPQKKALQEAIEESKKKAAEKKKAAPKEGDKPKE